MFGLGGMDPKKMQAMMRQMGIKQEEIEATRVIIEGEKRIVIENPSVAKITMNGQTSWQIAGEAREESGNKEEDIQLIMEKTGVDKSEAQQALEESGGDIASAILSLSK